MAARRLVRAIIAKEPFYEASVAHLSTSLQKRLNTYAIAASAAGVGVMSLTVSSEAEIVYTPVDRTVTLGHSYSLDLNHDGIVDFLIFDTLSTRGGTAQETFQDLSIKAAKGNRVKCVYSYCLSTFVYAAALSRGNIIDSRGRYHGWLRPQAQMAFEFRDPARGSTGYSGSWSKVRNRYLGLMFQINGEVHYGWARLTVEFHGGATPQRTWEAHLTGYAYEAIAGKSIHAGQTSEAPNEDENSDAFFPPNTPVELGALALGNSGISLWRRETFSRLNREGGIR